MGGDGRRGTLDDDDMATLCQPIMKATQPAVDPRRQEQELQWVWMGGDLCWGEVDDNDNQKLNIET